MPYTLVGTGMSKDGLHAIERKEKAPPSETPEVLYEEVEACLFREHYISDPTNNILLLYYCWTHHHFAHHSVAMREIDEQYISVDAMEESGVAGYEFYR